MSNIVSHLRKKRKCHLDCTDSQVRSVVHNVPNSTPEVIDTPSSLTFGEGNMDNLKIERTVDGRQHEIQVQQQLANGNIERIVTHREVIPANGTVVPGKPAPVVNPAPVVVNSNPVPADQNLITVSQSDECVTKGEVEELLKKYAKPAPTPVSNALTKSDLEALLQNYVSGNTAQAPAPVPAPVVPVAGWKATLSNVLSYVLITALAGEVGWLVWTHFIK